MTDTMTVKTPWHLWVVGVISLLWNGFGGYDFIQTTTRGEAYFRESGFDQAMIDYFNAIPNWVYVPWTLGVWGGVLGSLLLLLRSKWAVPVFALSLLGALVNVVHGKMDPMPPLPPEMAAMAYMPYVIVVIALFLLWYAWAQRKKGVLR